MEFVIYLVIGIIYAIASANGYNGRYSRNNSTLRNRYGLLGVEDFSLEYDPLERVRNLYNNRLQAYYQYKKPRLYLKNNFCELRLIINGNKTQFYCKEKTDGRKKGRFFEVKGNSEHASTMWAIIDMEFTKRSDYTSVRKLYYSLNQGFETTGGLRYFYEPWQNKYPNYDDDAAQNEYCRLELIKNENNQYVIICSEVWSKSPKQFVISGNKYLLQKIISDFAEEKNKFLTYTDLLAKYAMRLDCKVKELNSNEKCEQDTFEQTAKQEKSKKEPESYIHVDLEEKPKEISKKENEISNNQQHNIKKYNERNLDL